MRPLTLSRAVAAFLVLAAGIAAAPGVRADEPRIIEISAKRFEFSPKEITLKVGETVKLQLTTEDVAHGFFLKPLGIDEVIRPGKTTEIVVTPRAAGRFTTICDHFCGSGHGGMKMTIAIEPDRQP
jgi:cytochrome c oxidase subunit 2